MMNQAQIAGNRMKAQARAGKLEELEFTQGQFDDERDRLNASPHSGAPYSGYNNESEYRAGLNRQGQIAGLKSGGGAPKVSHTYAGTDFARRPSLSALSSASRPPAVDPNEESDNSAYYLRQNVLREGQLRNNVLEDAEVQRGLSDNPYRVEQRGNLAREELRRNAHAAGDASAEQASQDYFGKERIRQDQRYEQRSIDRERGYSDPAVEAARIKGQADVSKAALDKDRERSAALKAYSDLIKSQATQDPTLTRKKPGSGVLGTDWLAEDEEYPNPAWESHNQAIADARRVIGVDDGGDTGAEAGAHELTQEDVEAFASENGMTVQEAMALAQQHGYAIR